jgi:hypothetical protein
MFGIFWLSRKKGRAFVHERAITTGGSRLRPRFDLSMARERIPIARATGRIVEGDVLLVRYRCTSGALA